MGTSSIKSGDFPACHVWWRALQTTSPGGFCFEFPMGLGKPWWKPSGSLLEYHLASTPLISPVWSPEERPTKMFSPYLWLKFAYYHRAIKHGLLVPHLVWWFSQLHPFTWGLPSGLPSSVVGHIYIYIYIYMSDCENPRFTERTSTNLGRSHRLPHVCTIIIYGKFGGYRLQETAAFIYTYICDELWIICDIWVSLMWILEKYNDITLKRGLANLGRSHRLPRV